MTKKLLLAVFMAGIIMGIMVPNHEEMIMWGVSLGHEYIPEVYTCSNYTKDAILSLKGAGYEAYYVTGWLNSTNESHAWVKLCKDYEVTGITMPVGEDTHRRRGIINITEDGKPHGEICPWMKRDAWKSWCRFILE